MKTIYVAYKNWYDKDLCEKISFLLEPILVCDGFKVYTKVIPKEGSGQRWYWNPYTNYSFLTTEKTERVYG